MKKLTFQFLSLPELATFCKLLNDGYLINTVNLTLTTHLPEVHKNLAFDLYNATVIETTEKVFSYQNAE